MGKKVSNISLRDASERAVVVNSCEDNVVATAQPKKFFLACGDELVDHTVNHILYAYVGVDGDVLEPCTFYRAEGDICVLVREIHDLAGVLVAGHMALWSLRAWPHSWPAPPARLHPWLMPPESYRVSIRARKHRREGQELAFMIASEGLFDIPTENPCVKVWNVEVELPRTLVIQRIIVTWLQCVRIIQHPRHPSHLHVSLRTELALRCYTRGVPAIWPLQIADQCIRSVLHGWRQQLTYLQDKMMLRALSKKMVKLARSTIHSYAWKLMPLCHALDDFLNVQTPNFDRWLAETLKPRELDTSPHHRMNLWVR